MPSAEAEDKNNEEVSTFKKNLRKMIALEEEARNRKEGAEKHKLVSVRVEAFEGRKGGPGRDMIFSKKKMFENAGEYKHKGGVKEKVEMLSKRSEESPPLSNKASMGTTYVEKKAESGKYAEGDLPGLGAVKCNELVCSDIIGRPGCEVELVYRDNEHSKEQEYSEEVLIEEVRRDLLAELEEERSDEIDAINTFISSRNIPQFSVDSMDQRDKIITYVDSPSEDEGLKTDISMYGDSDGSTINSTRCKISDLSRTEDEHLSSSKKKFYPSDFEIKRSYQVIDTGGNMDVSKTDTELCEGPTVIVYQDPEEAPKQKGWLSSIAESLVSICCCGRPR